MPAALLATVSTIHAIAHAVHPARGATSVQLHPCPVHSGTCGYVGGPMTQSFFKFHADNPSVMAQIAADIRLYKAESGRQCASIQTFVEKARWEYELAHAHGEFALSNNQAAFIARWLMSVSDFYGFFNVSDAPEADAWCRHIGARTAKEWQVFKAQKIAGRPKVARAA